MRRSRARPHEQLFRAWRIVWTLMGDCWRGFSADVGPVMVWVVNGYWTIFVGQDLQRREWGGQHLKDVVASARAGRVVGSAVNLREKYADLMEVA